MPTYEYECDACGHAFEEWQSFTAEKLTACPACKKKKLRRLFGGGAAIVFKGSGFYETDYRRTDADKKAAKADSDAAAGKTETATEKKAETLAKTETPAASPEPASKPKGKKADK